MNIEEFVKTPLETFLKAERYLNDGSPSGFSDINSTSERTCPKSPTPSFVLHQVCFPDLLVEEFGAHKDGYCNNNCLFLHPDIYERFPDFNSIGHIQSDSLIVAPTASGRTVRSLDRGFFIKLAYPGYLGRLRRHLDTERILSSIAVTSQLMSVVSSKQTKTNFGLLREDFGRVVHIPKDFIRVENTAVNSSGAYELGMLLREDKPFPYVQQEEILIPIFSLFCENEYDPFHKILVKTTRPLVMQIYDRQCKPIEKFLLEDFLFPLYKTYFDALLLGGIELEAHAQNMLIAISSDYEIKRIVCRDLESAGRDAPIMDKLGIEYNTNLRYKLNIPELDYVQGSYLKYNTTHSFMFDFKLGEYITTPVLNVIEKYAKINRKRIEISIRDFNRPYISQLPSDFFPNEWCHYENVNWDKEEKQREYIWLKNPKYRWIN